MATTKNKPRRRGRDDGKDKEDGAGTVRWAWDLPPADVARFDRLQELLGAPTRVQTARQMLRGYLRISEAIANGAKLILRTEDGAPDQELLI